MLELSLKGSKAYWCWVAALVAAVTVGIAAYMHQYEFGLGITGLSRDISWGFYIAQLTFLVGVAASAVMVVLPYYLHSYKAFGKLTVIGEFTAVASISMCGLFLFIDIGQPARALNVFLYPSPSSIVFWDSMVLIGYLVINIIVGWKVTEAERNGVKPEAWVYPIIYLSIPWAFAIHTVTAFIYCGLPGRGFWLTAIMAPRFLASAFSAGPAFLVIVCLFLRRTGRFDPGRDAIQALAKIITYGLLANLFFLACEAFVVFYSGIPDHAKHFQYLYFGCVALFIGTWIDKGVGLVTGGFVPTTLNRVLDYIPTLPELLISMGIFAVGLLVLTILLKLVIAVRAENNGCPSNYIEAHGGRISCATSPGLFPRPGCALSSLFWDSIFSATVCCAITWTRGFAVKCFRIRLILVKP